MRDSNTPFLLGGKVFGRFLRNRWTDLLFWIVLAVATWAVVRPIWLGPIAPMTDFGGHASIADVWARLDEVDLYREMFERRTGLQPNTVSARFCGWLHPWVDAITGLRLFTTLMMVGTIGALIAAARAFDRSMWVVFLALPFLWNTGLHWGMVNYVAVFPFFFAALASARKAGQTGDWRWGLGLAAAGVASFFVHGLGAPFTVGAASFVLALSLQRPRFAFQFLAFVPATALFWYWKNAAQSTGGLPGDSLFEMLEHHTRWHDPSHKLELFIDHSINIAADDTEILVFVALLGVWLVWMAISPESDAFERDREYGEHTEGWRGGVARIWGRLQDHTLLLTALCLWAAFWIFPSYIHRTNIATRVVPLFVMTAALLPRLPERHVLKRVAGFTAVGACLWFGWYLDDTIDEFQRVEMEPIVELTEHIEPESRVDCFHIRGYNETLIHGSALNHNCPGLIQVRTSSFGGFHFPATGFNAITFRDGHGYEPIDRAGIANLEELQKWDYLVTDGPKPRPPESLSERVATASADGPDTPVWHLYRVRTFDRNLTYRERTGGPGGSPFRWHCPSDRALAGVRGKTTRDGRISTLRPLCQNVQHAFENDGESDTGDANRPEDPPTDAGGSGDDSESDPSDDSDTTAPRIALHGQSEQGPQIGGRKNSQNSFRARCPGGEFMVGLAGRAGQFVDRLDVLCAPVHPQSAAETDTPGYNWNPSEIQRVDGGGGDGGEPFEFRCPADSAATTMVGRSGQNVDAVGIGCTALTEIEKDARPDEETEK